MNIRDELERRLGREAIEAAWDYIVAEGHAAAVESREHDLNWLIDRVTRFLEHAGKFSLIIGRRPPVQMLSEDQRKRVSERHHALAILWAKEAGAEDDVIAFRKEVLRERLLKWEEVDDWLRKQARADEKRAGKREEAGLQTQVLAYALPSDAWEHCLPTTATGVLERLRQISDRLSQRYRWQEAQATIFVLTGRMPLVPSAEAKIEREAIVLTLDPLLTPRQVGAYYRQFRKDVLSGGRIRALSLKHLRLAAFDADRPSDESWAKKMEAWNRVVPKDKEWRYKNDGQFRRDCLQAQRRLLAPLPPPERRFLRYLENQKRDEQEQAAKSTTAKRRGEK
jgi:hypothetical protein